ncbi:hypothetical protein [Streptomyces sp. SID5770]|nr:hypothetical protein [Streptomyces sp. SID5770]
MSDIAEQQAADALAQRRIEIAREAAEAAEAAKQARLAAEAQR